MQLVLHIVGWAILLILPVYGLSQQSGQINDHLGRFYVQILTYVILFYLSYFWLVPKYFLTGRRILFLGLTAILFAAIYLGTSAASERFFKPPPRFEEMAPEFAKKFTEKGNPDTFRKRFFLVNYLFTSILISGFCVGLRVSEKLSENEQTRKELERQKLNSELAFLKNQISPHFFFNTLNNIYSLIGINQDDARDSVLKLSKLMRYLLYESEQGLTTLGLEISFMNHYIDLMRLRLSDKVDLHADFPNDHPDLRIPPLIFIPFIENAFKHGISYQNSSFIHISMALSAHSLVFDCRNSLGRATGEGPSVDSGIGLENVTKRLQLLYPNRHNLVINRGDDRFTVHLEIKMEPHNV
jgi:hypothetical protein